MPAPWCCTPTARWKHVTIRAPRAAPPAHEQFRRLRCNRRLHSAALGAMVPVHAAAQPRRSGPMSKYPLRRRLFRLAAAVLASALVAPAASAHPHVWVTMKSELL